MLFSSYVFIFAFLPIMLFGFYILRLYNFVYAKVFLLCGSLFFYGFWNILYLPLLLFSIVINFLIAKSINKISAGGGVKYRLIIGICFNILLLFVFKYTTFVLDNLRILTMLFDVDINIPIIDILLPLAISFFTFQQIAYLVDVYKGKISNSSFIDYCLFVSFFPQLIAGPIVHHSEMMPQFSSNNSSMINIYKGIFIFSIGLFKKVIIADNFGKIADVGFNSVRDGISLSAIDAWISSLSYTFQLYFDFSGYCDMAIGLALLFGIVLPINFNSPYKSLNITEFWRRWHITLGRFFKEYLYIPLGGNRFGLGRTLFNVFIVAFISGIWHGAGYGFVVWGALHGIAMVIHRTYRAFIGDYKFFDTFIYKVLCWFATFNFINITWIFFRSENINGSFLMIQNMLSFGGSIQSYIEIIYILFGLLLVLFCKNSNEFLKSFTSSVGSAFYAGILFYFSIIYIGMVPYVKFIYFNF